MSGLRIKLNKDLMNWYNIGHNDALLGGIKNDSNKTEKQQIAYDYGFEDAMNGEY